MRSTDRHPSFHPAVARWFDSTFVTATEVQRRGWAAIAEGGDTLIAAPTGSGNTLAAFLLAIDRLVRRALAEGLDATTRVLYVSPLKALSNDVHRNLQLPLEGVAGELGRDGLPAPEIRTMVRTGDTPAGERSRMTRTP
ncbi:MAG: DEAD/DEAH box helicase, partial [Myxococcales bacterium]|nr:DEAD/DEAH box helicase [Myxococcales bacterium]